MKTPSKLEHESFIRIVTTGGESEARAWVGSYFGIPDERIDHLECAGPADPERYKVGAMKWHVYLKETGKK